ncbi:MAG: flavodoxin [Bacteroidales bacterium]|nr:flavodoxin [Bacteroidales bacterium]
MRKAKSILMILSALFCISCSQSNANNKQNENNEKQTNGMNTQNSQIETSKDKVLVVFFSQAGEQYSVGNIKTGNTKIVADYICNYIGCDQFEIKAEKSYDMSYNDLINLAKQEVADGELPAFKGKIENIDRYSTIFIGGPVWWGTYPQVMFTFFKEYDLNNKTIIPFTTHEGSGLASCVDDAKKAYPNANVLNGFAMYGHDVRSNEKKVIDWLKKLGF